MPFIKKHSHGDLNFYNHYIIAVANEGVSLLNDLFEELQELAKTHYANKKFVYISHRKNSYSIDPNIYLKLASIKNMAGLAVVYGDTVMIDNTDFEKNFMSIPFKAFNTLDEAITWADELCGK